jgi:hypothetical protein
MLGETDDAELEFFREPGRLSLRFGVSKDEHPARCQQSRDLIVNRLLDRRRQLYSPAE